MRKTFAIFYPAQRLLSFFDRINHMSDVKPLYLNKYSHVPLIIVSALLFLPLPYSTSLLFILAFSLFLMLKYPLDAGLFEKLLWGAFLLRMAVLLLNESFSLIPEQSDDLMYNRVAMEIVDNLSRKLPFFYGNVHSYGIKGYATFLSLLYGVFGEIHMLAKLVNSFLGLLSGIVIYKIAIEIFQERKTALISAACALYLPSLIAFTSFVIRDAIILYFTYLLIYHFILLYKGERRLMHAVSFIILFILISILRIQNLYLYSAFFIFFFLLLLFRSGVKKSIKAGMAASILLICGIIFILNFDVILTVLTYPFRAQPLRAEGGSAYLTSMTYNNVFDIIKYLPIRFIYFTFGPFLWDAKGAFLLLSALEGLLVLAATVATLLYFHRVSDGENQNLKLFLITFCLIGLVANSIVDSNFGTSVRHRMNYIVFFFIFAAAYLQNKKFRVL
ncbi:phospholipid carrier-dependent glycosyltransferase [candidate division KSB1 bacterium]|nr:MAG: phospholipid carrier-dependent glycosyltransferase [candidate division KSB1 bacterium]